jgi:hypothetical protein
LVQRASEGLEVPQGAVSGSEERIDVRNAGRRKPRSLTNDPDLLARLRVRERDAVLLSSTTGPIAGPISRAAGRRARPSTAFKFIHLVEDGDCVFVTYGGHITTGTGIRNTEFLTVRQGKAGRGGGLFRLVTAT